MIGGSLDCAARRFSEAARLSLEIVPIWRTGSTLYFCNLDFSNSHTELLLSKDTKTDKYIKCSVLTTSSNMSVNVTLLLHHFRCQPEHLWSDTTSNLRKFSIWEMLRKCYLVPLAKLRGLFNNLRSFSGNYDNRFFYIFNIKSDVFCQFHLEKDFLSSGWKTRLNFYALKAV